MRLVLGDDADSAQARVRAVGQGEVDDAELAAEVPRGLGAHVGEVAQARAASAGEHQGEGAAGDPAALVAGFEVHGDGSWSGCSICSETCRPAAG
ncbi:MAG TPA: hypothetical protein PLC66_04530 [Thauera sp.]|nr:hypothetical protein [Thauera sp.]HRP23222.1 hypothetical protein [Thauera sp.]